MSRLEDRPTDLYRLFNAAGTLLYVGITVNTEQRFREHASTAPWWPNVASKTVTPYPSRSVAERAETEAIKAERPLHNRAGSDAPLGRDFADFNSVSIGQFRAHASDVLMEAAVRNRTIYLTNHGRRVAAIVPVPDAEALEAQRQGDPTES